MGPKPIITTSYSGHRPLINDLLPCQKINNGNVNMVPPPWNVKTIRREFFCPLPNDRVRASLSLDLLLLLEASVIAQSTNFLIQHFHSVGKAIRIVPQRSALLLHSLRLISDNVKRNTEQCSVMLRGQIRRKFSSFLSNHCVSVCMWTLHLQGRCSLLRFAQQEDLVYCLITRDFLFSSPSLPFSPLNGNIMLCIASCSSIISLICP